MSTKTNFKRVALVAVAALGLGVLTSVAPANAAAAAGDVTIGGTVGTTAGLCYKSNTAGATTATVTPGSSHVLTAANTDDNGFLGISGPAYFTAATSNEGLTNVAYVDSNSSGGTATLTASAVGTITVVYATSSTTAAVDVIVINVVAACGGGSYDAASSYAAVTTSALAQDTYALNTNTDSTAASVVVNAGQGYIAIALADAYGSPLSSGALIATVTSGDAFVNVADEANGSLPAKGTAKTAVAASTGAKAVVRVDQGTANAPTNATVQITFGGTVVATKSLKFQGAAASIDVTDVTIGLVGTGGYFRYQVKDSAGNALFSKSIADDATANASNTVAGALNIAAVTAADGAATPAVNQTNITAGTVARFSCVKAGNGTLNVKFANSALSVVKKAIPVSCSGALDTWTASMDKASYSPGEIATLTITGKDADGFLIHGNAAPTGIAASLGGMTIVTAVDRTNDRFNSGPGKVSYTFKVDTAEGAFVGVVKVTGATDTANKTIQYKIANASGAVSNADVLKAIVSLIASINKQIAALQKALLKR